MGHYANDGGRFSSATRHDIAYHHNWHRKTLASLPLCAIKKATQRDQGSVNEGHWSQRPSQEAPPCPSMQQGLF
jgi:hypothetical protein